MKGIYLQHLINFCFSFLFILFSYHLVPKIGNSVWQLALLQKESEIPLGELLARYKKVGCKFVVCMKDNSHVLFGKS